VVAGRISADAARLQQLAAELGITDALRWVGFVDDADLPALYRAAGCFVFPAVAEGFGLPVIEAMTCGTPVVAARAASLPEVVGAGGRLFAPHDDTDLANVLRAVLRAPDANRRALAASARERACEFSWHRTAAATERVLREAASIPPSRRWRRRVVELRRARHRLPPPVPRTPTR
jgi:glycosyltransferase involved in cell wall biosynthesis